MKRCKNCKEPFTPIRTTLEKYCSKSECMQVFISEAKEKAWKKTKAVKKEELMTVQDYVKIAQQVFNKYIRLRDKDKGCISCGKPLVGKFDAGHYWSAGGHWNVRFDERNTHGQCVFCNQHKHGNINEYAERLPERIGMIRFMQLGVDARETRKFTIEELKEIIETYKQKIKEL